MLSNGPGPERGLLSRFPDLIRGSRAPGSGETDLRRALEARSTEDLSSIHAAIEVQRLVGIPVSFGRRLPGLVDVAELRAV